MDIARALIGNVARLAILELEGGAKDATEWFGHLGIRAFFVANSSVSTVRWGAMSSGSEASVAARGRLD
jgi:hypothetical protein